MAQIYKKGQGKYTRTTTLVAAVVLAAISAVKLAQFLKGYPLTSPALVRFSLATLLVVVVGLVVGLIVNRPRPADFLIATEGEMKKVSWSSRKEIVGSTKVVIVTTFIMAAMLFAVDMVFVFLFKAMGVTG